MGLILEGSATAVLTPSTHPRSPPWGAFSPQEGEQPAQKLLCNFLKSPLELKAPFRREAKVFDFGRGSKGENDNFIIY